MLIELSYPIGPETNVLDPSLRVPRIVPRSHLDEGKRSSTGYIEIFAHAGTHIDAPWHFDARGCQTLHFAIEDFVFQRVLLVDIPKEAWQPVTREEVAGYEDELASCDALLTRSGFSRYRSTNPDLYVRATPGVSVEAAQFLAGFSSPRCRETGFPTHHSLLARPEPMLLIEDANLAVLQDRKMSRLFLFPPRMSGLEASPVTAGTEV